MIQQRGKEMYLNLVFLIFSVLNIPIMKNIDKIDNIEIYYIDFNIIFRRSISEDEISDFPISNKLVYKYDLDINKIINDINSILINKKEIEYNSYDARVLINFYIGDVLKEKISFSKNFEILKYENKYYEINESEIKILKKYFPAIVNRI